MKRLLLVALLEQGDLPGAEQQAVAYERAARRLGIPRYGWLPEIWRAMRALLDGEPDRALEHAAAGSVKVLGVPIKMSETIGAVRTPPPLLGEHTDAVLGGLLGFGSAQIAALRADGVV